MKIIFYQVVAVHLAVQHHGQQVDQLVDLVADLRQDKVVNHQVAMALHNL